MTTDLRRYITLMEAFDTTGYHGTGAAITAFRKKNLTGTSQHHLDIVAGHRQRIRADGAIPPVPERHVTGRQTG